MTRLKPSAFPELRRVFDGYLHEDVLAEHGTPEAALGADGELGKVLRQPGMAALRAGIRAGERAECATCVCALWRDAADTATLLPAPAAALRGA